MLFVCFFSIDPVHLPLLLVFTQTQGDNLRFREHRKLISGRISGRNRAEQLDAGDDVQPSLSTTSPDGDAAAMSEGAEGGVGAVDAVAAAAAAKKKAELSVPPLRGETVAGEGEGEGDGVDIEWWDEAFLTKEVRDQKVGYVEKAFLSGGRGAGGEGGVMSRSYVMRGFLEDVDEYFKLTYLLNTNALSGVCVCLCLCLSVFVPGLLHGTT